MAVSAKKVKANTATAKTVTPTQVAVTKPVDNVGEYQVDSYSSKYQGQIDDALNAVTNRGEFTYDPLKDANYQQLARLYNANGEKAAKNSLADAASLNGGYGSSYAVAAAQQARNDYNQQLAALVPELEQNAYGRWKDAFDMDVTKLGVLRDADDTDYGRYRDIVGDKQWKYGMDYQKYRDSVSDYQWGMGFNESAKEWAADFNENSRQWAKGFNESSRQWANEFNENSRQWAKGFNQSAKEWAEEFAETKKTNAIQNAYTRKQTALLGKSNGGSSVSGGGSGRSRRSSSGGGYSSSGGGGGSSSSGFDALFAKANNQANGGGKTQAEKRKSKNYPKPSGKGGNIKKATPKNNKTHKTGKSMSNFGIKRNVPKKKKK